MIFLNCWPVICYSMTLTEKYMVAGPLMRIFLLFNTAICGDNFFLNILQYLKKTSVLKITLQKDVQKSSLYLVLSGSNYFCLSEMLTNFTQCKSYIVVIFMKKAQFRNFLLAFIILIFILFKMSLQNMFTRTSLKIVFCQP